MVVPEIARRRPARHGAGVLACLLGMILPAASRCQTAPTPDSLLTAATEATAAPLSVEDLADFSSGESSSPSLRWFLRSGTPGRAGELAASGRTWAARWRGRWSATSPVGHRWCLRWRPGAGLELAAGRLAAVHGAGLVAGRPDRSPTLDVDRFLSWYRPGWRRAGGTGGGIGLALSLARGDWRAGLLRQAVAGSGGDSGADLLWAERRLGRRGGLAGMVGRDDGGTRSWSLLLDVGSRPWRLAVELGGAMSRGGPPARVVELDWRDRQGSVRLALAAAPPGWRGTAGGRVPLLPSGGGAGRSLRWSRRGGNGRVVLLLAGGDVPLDGPAPGWRTWRRVAMAWRHRGAWGRAGVRCRCDRSVARRWGAGGERTTVSTGDIRSRRHVSLWWHGWLDGHAVAAAWRLVEQDVPGEARRRRQLCWWRWEGGSPHGWAWRLRWTRAWGDPLDLVTVSVPQPGRLLTRHWGRWRTGVTLGVRRHWSRWRLGITLGIRRPAGPTGSSDRFLEVVLAGGVPRL